MVALAGVRATTAAAMTISHGVCMWVRPPSMRYPCYSLKSDGHTNHRRSGGRRHSPGGNLGRTSVATGTNPPPPFTEFHAITATVAVAAVVAAAETPPYCLVRRILNTTGVD